MESPVNFDVNDSLRRYLSDPATITAPEAADTLQECEGDTDTLTTGLVNTVLNPIVESIADNPEALRQSNVFDSLQALLKFGALLPASSLGKLLDVLVSGISTAADIVNNDTETEENDALQQHKQLLEMYAFLMQWALSVAETKAPEKSSKTVAGRSRASGKNARAKSTGKDETWDSTRQLLNALEAMSKVLRLKLSRILVTTSERDTFVGMFTRPVYLIFESEQRAKNTSVRMHAYKVLCIAIKHHGHAHGAQISIMQNLSYFEHLSEPMAEMLHILAEQYDYPQLADEVLRDISAKEFNSNDLKGPKSISTFVIKLSELVPRLVIKQMTLLAKQLDSDSYALRCAIIEVCGNLIADLSKQEERTEATKTQINSFFDILEERYLDINPYCRSRVIQVFTRLCDLDQKFPKRRQGIAEITVRSLEDKSSTVRRNAIKLLSRLVATHPFSAMHGGQLSRGDWQTRLEAVRTEIEALTPSLEVAAAGANQPDQVDETLLDDATMIDEKRCEQPMLSEQQQREVVEKAAKEAADAEMLTRLQLTRKYYFEALKFVDVLEQAATLVVQLLSSKNKSEVVEAMDFFVVLDAYKVESARAGIRRMLRLIWTKGNSDEGKGIQTHLMDCYKSLFFEAPNGFTENDAANYVARNMISLTFGATTAELTSLEQLLGTMVRTGAISDLVISKLWQVYGVQRKDISRNQRRGAIAVLGMLASADPEIVIREMDVMLRIGLGPLGQADLSLARYTCIALQRIRSSGREVKDKTKTGARLANGHAILGRLAAMTLLPSESSEWYGVAEQAVAAIYALAQRPDGLCTEILQRKARAVFAQRQQQPANMTSVPPDATGLATPPPEDSSPKQSSSVALSQLLFLVGHIAVKQIVHLEICEQDFKRRKAEREKAKISSEAATEKTASTSGKEQAEAPDELDLIGSTTEDDFADAIAHIRERELLYDNKALLARFGPLVANICANNTTYADPDLQAAATLCMAKLMCVSSAYCEQQLPLLITILERSTDPITRSNVVVALGDMAVCFNHLIDENTDFLYRRLKDDDASVKRTCLMTLTFLILAGQVKVKGQLGEMAKCLEDGDRRIADLSKMFFTELATKDNAVYNQFVDMFSVLSAEPDLAEDAFRRIIKFLSSFIEKDKHAKQLADKLAARLGRCESERQWNDVVYALSQLQHKNEEIQKTVGAGFRMVQAAA